MSTDAHNSGNIITNPKAKTIVGGHAVRFHFIASSRFLGELLTAFAARLFIYTCEDRIISNS